MSRVDSKSEGNVASINSLWKTLLGVEQVVVEDWDFEEVEQQLVITLRPVFGARDRCSICGRRAPKYDRGGGRRRWRSLDFGTVEVLIEAESPRVACSEHGVVVASVPWARPLSKFTSAFQDQCAWLAVHTSRSATAELMRVAWRSVGRMVDVVGAEARKRVDLLTDLRRIGIDEVSYRKGHKYLTVVVDHDTGRLVWLEAGRDEATVRRFFDALGPVRCKELALVSADGAAWISSVVTERAPQAIQCLDPFHVVQWATKALDDVRREVWNDLRTGGDDDRAKHLKNARWALWKNPENLTTRQRETLGWIPKVNQSLYRAYLLKEALRTVFHAPSLNAARRRLSAWLAWSRRSQLRPFVKLARTIREYLPRINAALEHRLTNARVEATNTQIRLLTRIAHGFRHTSALIGLAMLKLAGLCPPLPGRMAPTTSS